MIISLLLKKALPFALTFVVGTALGGLTWLFGGSEKKTEKVVVTRTYEYSRRCRMSHKLVAETKPLVILDKPAADLSLVSPAIGDVSPVAANVTFGADGKVQKVEPVGGRFVRREVWEAVESAAHEIQFEPETVDGLPVTVTREIEIQPWRCGNMAPAQR